MTSYNQELEIALLAVQRATILTKKVFYEKEKGTISKDDTSPVTIGDFGAQALIIHALKKKFPGDQIVGEEEASSLRKDQDLRGVIWNLVKETSLTDSEADTALGGPVLTMEDMLDSIDQGNSTGGNKGRIWALDPIDGTKGFLRGGQYAVCLALMVDGDVKVGVLGCPNLLVNDSDPLTVNSGFDQTNPTGKGILISAVSGQGATSRPLSTGRLETPKSIHMREVKDISQTIFCESVEKAHSSHDIQDEIAKKLRIGNPGVQMDSQAKYASLARGTADIYLRLTLRPDYQEKIWDHAAGDIIVREAGGEVTDIYGRRLDFSRGRTLAENKGVVAASKMAHAEVIKAVKEILSQKQRM